MAFPSSGLGPISRGESTGGIPRRRAWLLDNADATTTECQGQLPDFLKLGGRIGGSCRWARTELHSNFRFRVQLTSRRPRESFSDRSTRILLSPQASAPSLRRLSACLVTPGQSAKSWRSILAPRRLLRWSPACTPLPQP